MATQMLEKARWHSGEHRIVSYGEASSQSFLKGQFVYLASGLVTVCADDATTILGMTLIDATTATTGVIPVVIATDNTRFEGNVYHATAASAITAATNLGVKYGLEVDSNRCYVDIGQTAADAFTIDKILVGGGKSVGDTYGRVVFKVIAAVRQDDAAAT